MNFPLSTISSVTDGRSSVDDADKAAKNAEVAASRFTMKNVIADPPDNDESGALWYGLASMSELLFVGHVAASYLIAERSATALSKASKREIKMITEGLVPDTKSWERSWVDYKNADAFLRIGKAGKSDFKISIRLKEISVNAYNLLDMTDFHTHDIPDDAEAGAKTSAILGFFSLAGSAAGFTINQPTDFEVSVPKLSDKIIADMKDAVIVTDEGLDAFNRFAKSIRFISPPVVKGWRSEFEVPTKGKDDEGNEIETQEQVLSLASCPKDRQNDYIDYVSRNRTWHVFLNIVIPAKYMEYMVQKKTKDIRLSDIGVWSKQWADALFTGDAREFNYSINSLSSIVEGNKGAQEERRVNEDLLGLNRDGVLYYIPNIGDAVSVKEYEDAIEDAGTQEDGEWLLVSHDAVKYGVRNQRLVDDTTPQRRERPNMPANTLVYVDWVNMKISYTDTNATLKLLDVETFMSAKTSAIVKVLDTPLTDSSNQGASLVASLFRAVSMVDKDWSDLADPEAISQFFGVSKEDFKGNYAIERIIGSLKYGNVAEYINGIFNLTQRLTYYYERDTPPTQSDLPRGFTLLNEEAASRLVSNSVPDAWKLSEIRGDSDILPLRCIRKVIEDVYKFAFQDVKTTLSKHSVINGMQELAILLVVHKFAPQYKAVQAKDAKERAPYTKIINVNTHKVSPAAGFAEGKSLLPHQVKVDAYLDAEPMSAILGVSAGGGKTMQILKDIATNIDRGIIKRPLIVCPGPLVKDYVKENADFCGGRYNMLVLTTASVNKIRNTRGDEWLDKMLSNPPPNTIVVASYSFMKGKTSDIPYGPSSISVSANTELIKLYNADAFYADESHILRNPDTQQSRAVQRLAMSIPRRRLATGTLLTNQLSDLVGQFRLIDPSVLGDMDDFITKYADPNGVVGGKVVKWKDGAQAAVHKLISQNARLIVVKRKEWQFLLPQKIQSFHPCSLSDAQQVVYEEIMKDIAEKMENDPKLIEMIEKVRGGAVDDEGSDDDDSGVDNAEALDLLIEGRLKRYLARVERFLVNPGADELGKSALSGDDLVGPKCGEVNRILKEHIGKGIKGKVLIFSQYHTSTDAIWENMPQGLREKTVYYKAGAKDKDLEAFNRDPNKVILIGVETSLGTGLNLQHASRLIRVENVWNPGSLEQAESRINRPDPKNKDQRSEIFLDWVICDNTMDVTKAARLMSKLLYNLKFEEVGNPIYANVPVLPVIDMSFDTLRALNDWEQLKDYLLGYKEFMKAERVDYERFRADPNFKTDFVPIPTAELPKGSKLVDMPYIPVMSLPNLEALGIEKYTDYARNNGDDTLDDPIFEFDSTGLRVHTEFGDGEILGGRKNVIRVMIDGEKKARTINKLETFIITGNDISKSVKEKLAEIVDLPTEFAGNRKGANKGIKKVVVKAPTPVPEETGDKEVDITVTKRNPKRPVPNTDYVKQGKINLYLSVINNSVALSVDSDDPDIDEKDFLKLGFRHSGPYIFCRVPNASVMRKLVAALEAKYTISPTLLGTLHDMEAAFNQGKKKLLNVTQATQSEMRNFFKLKVQPTAADVVKPYPIIQDGDLYVCFNLLKQPAANKLSSKIRIPGLKWERSDGDMWKFTTSGSKAEAIEWIKSVIGMGYVIENKAQIKEELSEIRLVRGGKRQTGDE